MAIGVAGRIFIQVMVNGTEIPLGQNVLDSFHMVESVRTYVPMATMVIKDTEGTLSYNNLLTDGVPIQLTLEASQGRNTYYFRLFNYTEQITQGIPTYTIYMYLDVPRYWTESTAVPIHGSVSSVLEQICTYTKLTYDGVTTADSQLWLPSNRRYAEFARDVSERTWMTSTSCCQMAITADKVMRLVDVSKSFKGSPVQQFTNKSDSQTQTSIGEYKVSNKSGFLNTMTGYKDTKIVQSLVGTDMVFKDLDLNKNSSFLMMNSSIHSGIVQNKVTYAPVDVGNVSNTYELARYQNRRLSNLFSFGLEFVTTNSVTADVLDVVNLELAKPKINAVQAYSGKFLLTSKVTYVVGMNVYTKCEVFRHGLNTQLDSQI